MDNIVSIVLVGIGGYGNSYIKALMEYDAPKQYKIVGVVDPKPENCNRLAQLQEVRVPIYNTMEEFYAENSADLAIICSPIQFHCQQASYALAKGSHVLCEKPLAPTIQDALKMVEAKTASGKMLGIGYQWSFSKAILELKQDIISGKLGKAKRLKTIVLWPRTHRYYHRNNWAGKICDHRGIYVLDSVANNATSHFLHNMFYILGGKEDTSALPKSVSAELYRANDIETFDTSAVRVITEEEVEILFYASHAVQQYQGPVFEFEFEKATVCYGRDEENVKAIVVRWNDGTSKIYGNPDEGIESKIWTMIDAIKGLGTIPCGAEAAMAQTLCINGMHESVPDIVSFPNQLIKEYFTPDGSDRGMYVEGLDHIFLECYRQWKLPGESGLPWAATGKTIDLKGYRCFKGGK